MVANRREFFVAVAGLVLVPRVAHFTQVTRVTSTIDVLRLISQATAIPMHILCSDPRKEFRP